MLVIISAANPNPLGANTTLADLKCVWWDRGDVLNPLQHLHDWPVGHLSLSVGIYVYKSD